MKFISGVLCLAAVCAVGLGAQSSTTKSKTKVEVKDGKDITVSGCLERNPGGGYMLTTTNGSMKYALVTDDDLSKHLGHRVELKGKAADRGDGKVKIESEVGTGGDKSTAKTEVKGGEMSGMHYLGMKSLKMISASCM
jgi:uncharacterized protein DUF5818